MPPHSSNPEYPRKTGPRKEGPFTEKNKAHPWGLVRLAPYGCRAHNGEAQLGSGGERTPRVAPSALAPPGGDAQIRVRGAGGLQHPLTETRASSQPTPAQRSSVRRLFACNKRRGFRSEERKRAKQASRQATTNACSLDAHPNFCCLQLVLLDQIHGSCPFFFPPPPPVPGRSSMPGR